MEKKYSEEDMQKAFEAGCDWECWSLRGTGDEDVPPYFDEWIRDYSENKPNEEQNG